MDRGSVLLFWSRVCSANYTKANLSSSNSLGLCGEICKSEQGPQKERKIGKEKTTAKCHLTKMGPR